MPLILAIESDKRQAAQLTSMVRSRLKAELVLADSAERGLQTLAGRIPDLILTPALLSPRDEGALTDHLRRLNSKAAHVQTLTVPLLAAVEHHGSVGRSVLSALRRDKAGPAIADGCDPAVFAEQVQAYLERAAAERQARGHEDHDGEDSGSVRLQADRPGDDRGSVRFHADRPGDDRGSVRLQADQPGEADQPAEAGHYRPVDIQTWQAEWNVAELKAAVAQMPAAQDQPAAPVDIDLVALLDAPAPVRTEPAASPEASIMAAVAAVERSIQVEAQVDATPATQPAELRLPSLTPDPPPQAAAPAPAKRAGRTAPLPTMKTTAEPPRKKVRRPKPLQDEWGLFDPTQCGFAALVDRLEEISGAGTGSEAFSDATPSEKAADPVRRGTRVAR